MTEVRTELSPQPDLSLYKRKAIKQGDTGGFSVWKTITLENGQRARVPDEEAYDRWAKDHLKLRVRMKSKLAIRRVIRKTRREAKKLPIKQSR